MKRTAKFILKIATAAALIFILQIYLHAAPNYTLKDLGKQYKVDWVGNSFPATKIISRDLRQHVQQEIEDIFVKPDGTIYSNAVWDERFAQASAYKDGSQIAIMEKMLGYGIKGGYAVTAKGNNLYVATQARNIGRSRSNKYANPVYPQKNEVWYGVRVYRAKTAKLASFAGGYGENASFIVVNSNQGDIHGLATFQQYLYVSDTFNDRIKVYDLKNLTQQPVFSWSVERPGKLAFDREGQLWVVRYQTNHILRFSPEGKILTQQIALPEKAIASDIAINPQGNLLVTDIGKEQNIKIYEQITTKPKLKRTFGQTGGIFTKPQGKFAPRKFYNLKGIGTDKKGNIYLAQDAWSSVGGGGTIIASYQPNGDLRWQICSLEFMSGLDIDPEYEKLLYSKERLYSFDRFDRPGKTTAYLATTLDPLQYPNDPRLHGHFTGVHLQRIGDKTLLFMKERNGNAIAIFRFEPNQNGNIAIPYGLFSSRGNEWIPQQSSDSKAFTIWLDNNLNGQFDADEFIVPPIDEKKQLLKRTKWFVDSDGTIWTIARNVIRQCRMSELHNGYPVWDYSNSRQYSIPSIFTRIRHINYDRATDSMYVTGYTSDAPYTDDWKAIGKKIARFDSWSSSPTLKWTIDAPWYYRPTKGREKPIAFDTEGDYVFVGLGSTGKNSDLYQQSTVFVYGKTNGKYIGSMQHKNRVGPIMLDKSTGLNVRKTKDEEYLVFLEDAAYARSIMFHWQPMI